MAGVDRRGLFLRFALARLYTNDQGAAAIGAHLLLFVAVFVIFDALQSIPSFVLRAYGRTVAPMVIDVGALWGLGLVGGYLLGFRPILQHRPLGVTGLWLGATGALMLVAVIFNGYAAWIVRRVRRDPSLIPQLGAQVFKANA